MISDSTVAYVWVVFWAFILHSIGPVSTLCCILGIFLSDFAVLPKCIQLWAFAESGFFVWTILYQRYYLQRPALHPTRLSKEARRRLFELCHDSTQDYERYIEKWFLGKPLATIKRDNIKEFFRWAFFDSAILESEYEDEVDEYVAKLELELGTKFEPGRSDVKCIRLTIDKVGALHRSLTWYMCILVVDVLTYTYMNFLQFQWYRTSIRKCLAIIPPRPYALLASNQSPAPDASYWCRSHTSKKEVPILFLHGIGVGLYPYMEFLKELNQDRSREDGDIGIIAIELLPISSRITSIALRKEAMCDQLRIILDRHGFKKFVLASHSYGSVITTHVMRTPDLASRVFSVILIDPVSILLHQPDVAYNFTVRKPKLASEWLLWYFGSKDVGVAHTLSRTFFWSENILWKEDLFQHRATVFLSGKDSIINAPQVRAYLEDAGRNTSHYASDGERQIATEDPNKYGGQLSVVWCEGLNHGQVFDLPVWRSRLRNRVLIEAVGCVAHGSVEGVASKRVGFVPVF